MAGKHEGNVQSLFGQGEAVEIDVFTSGKELTETDRDYDIALLDIEMPVQDGIRIKEYFEAGRRQTTIINLYGQILEIEESGETVFIPVKQIRYKAVMAAPYSASSCLTDMALIVFIPRQAGYFSRISWFCTLNALPSP